MRMIFLVITICSLFSFPTRANEKIFIIVNNSNPVQQLTVQQIKDYFLKKTRHWPDGAAIRFFDRSDSPERKFFLKNYIQKTNRQVEQFWIGQKLYTGDSAPTQINSDSMMVSLVSRFPGGVGYVSSQFKDAKGVKVVEVLENR